jgi:signal transduction histidine kinase
MRTVAPPRSPDHDRPHPGEGRGRSGERLHFRTLTLARTTGPITITASGPRRLVEAPLREAMLPLLGSLALLGAGLAAATLVQLRIGLRPLRTLQASLGEVIAGRRRHVPTDLPIELAPLATELNTLIDQNAEGLAHARRHVANLAHGLKTPLAALGLELAERDPNGRLAAMLADIDRRVSHHLRRARAAVPGAPGREAIALAPAIADLIDVLRRVHADRAIMVDSAVPDGLSVGVDAQDLDEMVGNLLDNAWRHARGAIRVAASADTGKVAIVIDDDGAGLDDSERTEALMPGRRLDEAGPGHGFGLPITQELAELNGGSLILACAPTLGGLRAVLTL